jgi:hypothetical protein
MAIPADTVWEVEATGSDLNGGGWSTASKGATGVDMTLGAATSFTSTLSATGTTTLTDSANGFVNTMRGNVINIVGQGFYCITAFTSSSAVTVDRALGTFSTTSGKVGGPVASPGMIGGVVVAGNTAYIQSGSYTITSASTNISGGCVSSAAGSIWAGYSTNRTMYNSDTRPVFTLNAGVSTSVMFAAILVCNLALDGASQTSSRGCTAPAMRCKFSNFTNAGTNTVCLFCEFTGCATVAACSGFAAFCVAHGNSIMAFSNQAYGCIAYGNTATPFGSNSTQVINCVAYSNTGASTDGFINTSATGHAVAVNCIAESNGRYGFNSTTPQNPTHLLINCSTFGNSTSGTNGLWISQGLIATTVSAFLDPASQDFRLNALAGGGALLRGAGFPSPTWPTGGWPSLAAAMVAYLDIGAVQSRNLAARWDMGGGMNG